MGHAIDEDLERGISLTPSKQNQNPNLFDMSPSSTSARSPVLMSTGKVRYVKQVIGRYSDTELHVAAYRGDLNSVTRIINVINSEMVGISSGADFGDEVAKIRASMVNEMNELGETALYIAAEKGHLEVVKELLNYSDKETLTRRSHLDFDPLHIAARQGHTAVVEVLLSKDPSLLYIPRSNGKNALHLAARSGHFDTVKSLIEKDPHLARRTDKKGQTALHKAVKGASNEVVKLLLEADAAIVVLPDNSGHTALHVATRKKRVEIVKKLLCHPDTKLNALTRDCKTVLDIAEGLSSSEESTEIRDCLVCQGAVRANEQNQPRDELRNTVNQIKNDVQGMAKEFRKLHRKGVDNDTNSVTVAVLFAAIAYAAIFTVPGGDNDDGMAVVASMISFKIFYIFNAIALYTSLAVVMVHMTLGLIGEGKIKRRVVEVISKSMSLASVCTFVAFIASSYIVIGREHEWVAVCITVVGASTLIGVLGTMTYCLVRWKRTQSLRRMKKLQQRTISSKKA